MVSAGRKGKFSRRTAKPAGERTSGEDDPILQGFGDVSGFNSWRILEVGDRSAHTQHTITSACAEAELLNRGLEQPGRRAVERAMLAKGGAFHCAVRLRFGRLESASLQ